MKRILLLIFLIALSIRVGLLWYNLDNVGSYGTATLIGESARNLVEGNGYSIDRSVVNEVNKEIYTTNKLVEFNNIQSNGEVTKFYQLTPGSSALLALSWLFGDYRFIYLKILQVLIDAFGCIVIFLLGKELFEKRVGYIASGIYALYLPIAYLSTVVIHDALMPVLILTSFYFLVMGIKHNYWYYAVSALFIGIACYFQPTVIYLGIMYGIGVLIYTKRFMYSLRVLSVMVVVVAIVVTPWIVRNYKVTGLLTTNMRVATWSCIWEGIGEYKDNPIGASLSDDQAIKYATEKLGHGIEFGSPEFDSVFKPEVINVITNHTSWYAGAIIKRIPRTIFYVNAIGLEPKYSGETWKDSNDNRITWMTYTQVDSPLKFALEHPLHTMNWGLVALFMFVPVIISIVALFISGSGGLLLLTIPVYLGAVHSVTFVSGAGKSLLPGAIAFIVLSAVFIDYVYGKVKE